MRKEYGNIALCPVPIITDGLIFHLDGKNKTNNPAYKWMDFVGGYNFTGSGVEEIEDGFRFCGSYGINYSIDELLTCNALFDWKGYDKRKCTYEFVASVRGWTPFLLIDAWENNNSQVIFISGSDISSDPINIRFGTKEYPNLNYGFKATNIPLDTKATYSMTQNGPFAFANGIKLSSYGTNTGGSNSERLICVGGRMLNSTTASIGNVDIYEIRIYNRTLSDAEILQNQQSDKVKYGLQF